MLIQYPTPYKLVTTDSDSSTTANGRNAQLPSLDTGFMVSPEVCELVVAATRNNASEHGSMVYLQSNVEDVAVTLVQMLENADSNQNYRRVTGTCNQKLQSAEVQPMPSSLSAMHSANVTECTSLSSSPLGKIENSESRAESRRQLLWRERGGERATGPGWVACAVFPYARTETEASYEILKRPLFRRLWIRWTRMDDN